MPKPRRCVIAGEASLLGDDDEGATFLRYSMHVPGYMEGCNNKTKVRKRVTYGMRNFNNFRRRILFCNT